MYRPLLYSCLVLGLYSCKKEADASAGVSIRVRNESSYPFTAVLVNTSGGENSYGSLRPGQNSDYHSFAKAYSYAYVKATVNGQDVLFQPVDYVGETPLQPGGQYTYAVDVVNSANGAAQYLRVRLVVP
jgi:hypothetical protein